MEMPLRGRIDRTLVTSSYPTPRSLETRTERGFPHFHSDGCSGGPNLTNTQKVAENARFSRFLFRNPVVRGAPPFMSCYFSMILMALFATPASTSMPTAFEGEIE